MAKKSQKANSKKAEDLTPSNPLVGKSFINIERLSTGWVARLLTVTEDDIKLEALCETSSSFRMAKIRAMKKFEELCRKEVRKHEKR